MTAAAWSADAPRLALPRCKCVPGLNDVFEPAGVAVAVEQVFGIGPGGGARPRLGVADVIGDVCAQRPRHRLSGVAARGEHPVTGIV